MTKYGDANDSVVRQTSFETTCLSGTFDPPVIPVKRGTATFSEHPYVDFALEYGIFGEGTKFQPIRSEKTVLSRFCLRPFRGTPYSSYF